MAVEADLRAMRRLARIGRRRFALELAAKYREPIEPLFEPTTTEYSVPVNTSNTAVPPSDSKQPPKPVPPLLWIERDAWEWKRKPDGIEAQTSARRRMVMLTIAIDNEGADYGNEYDNAVQLGSDLHRADRGDNRNIRQVRRAAS